MAGELSHHEAGELLGAYALDAVDSDERDALERHLRDCRVCATEVREHRETASLLWSGALRPPEHVWGAIAGSLDDVPAAAAPELFPLSVVGGDPSPRRRIRARFVTAGVGAVAAALIGLVAVNLATENSGRLGRGAPSEELARAADAARRDPGARNVELRSTDGAYFAETTMLRDGTGYVVRTNLPDLPPDRTYQLWAVVGENKVSIGVLGPSPGPAAFRATAEVAALAITEEEAGGVSTTDQQPVVVGKLSEA